MNLKKKLLKVTAVRILLCLYLGNLLKKSSINNDREYAELAYLYYFYKAKNCRNIPLEILMNFHHVEFNFI